MASIIKNIIVVIGLLALAGVGYYLFVANHDATIQTTGGSASAEVETQAMLKRLEDLQSIRISTEILRDSKFQSLRSFNSVVSRVPVGRSEPFLKPRNSF